VSNIFSSTKFKRLIILLCLILAAAGSKLFAQTFTQKLSWSSDPNVLEYKVEIKDSSGKIIQTITTQDNFVELSLTHGKYKCRITAYDLLGRESVSTVWQDFEVISQKEEQARIAREKAEQERIAAEKAERERLEAERIAKEKAEKERLAKEEAERKARELEEQKRLEEERLAREKAEEEERLAREKAEEERRLALEKAEQEERERLACEEAERQRIAAEIAAQEEAERLEAERLKREEEERAEAERLAQEKAEEEEELKKQKKEERRKAWENYDRKFGLAAGAGLSFILYDGDFFSDYMTPSLLNPNLNGKFSYLPFHNNILRFGMEFDAMATRFNSSNQYYNLNLSMLFLQENLALRFKLKTEKSWLQIKAGAGIVLVNENLDYYDDTDDNKKDTIRNFGFITVGGGLSLVFVPTRLITIELGADYNHLFIPDMNMGLLSPYVSLGLRF
jgi:hypothetical protein